MLSLTFVPAAVALFLRGDIEEKENLVMRRRARLLRAGAALRIALAHRRWSRRGGVRRALRLARLAHGRRVHPQSR